MILKKYWLYINGAKRMVVCAPDDTLASVLRRMGLTGVKVGCDAGQCGACSVILDGKVVRSCVVRMKKVAELAQITTIEGIGTPTNLHPLQAAWNYFGAVQCGFCSPGFIVSAKALLDENPDPSREEIREWFQKHRNICRCTGYKPIVDAVIGAAKVLRGELSMDDITFHVPEDGKLYSTPVPRFDSGISRVTGLANYGDDVRLHMPEETLELAPVLAEVAHAKILSIDPSEALNMKGVVGFVSAKDVKGTNRIAFSTGHPRAKATGSERPIFVDEKVFKYGDVVGVIAADTRENARAAAKRVKIEYDLLPAYETQLEAMLPDALEVHEGIPNILLKWPLHKGQDTKDIMEQADYVVEGSFSTSREPHLPIEPDVVQAYMGEDDVLTVQYKSQYVYALGYAVAEGIGYPVDKIRVVQNEVGGSFGYSVSPHTSAIAAVATLVLGRPVNMTLTYAEHQHITGKRCPSHSNVRLAIDKNGMMQALEYQLSYEQGAYTKFPQALLQKCHLFMGFPYSIPNIQGISEACYSNIGYGTTYRGFGAPQTFMGSESIVDMAAEAVDMDPFEFRYKNIAREGDKNTNGAYYNEYPMEKMMDILRPKYYEAKENARAKSTDDKKYGVGISWGGFSVGDPIDSAAVSIELLEDGTIVNHNTWQDIGQHAEAGAILHTYEALRPMNVPIEKIRVDMSDTATSPDTGISGGSRMHYHCGNATIDGCKKLMAAMRKDDGTYRTYQEMVEAGIPTKYEGTTSTPQGISGELDANTAQGRAHNEIMYSLYMAEVQVDIKTGKTKVERMTCVADIGVVGNVIGAEGQAYGGMMHSIGFALKEDYSDVKKHNNMVGAGTMEIIEVPDDLNVIFNETYRKDGPYGSAGASENFQSSAHVAVLNAIHDAANIRIYELPAKPEKILEALHAKEMGAEQENGFYFLGGDLYDELDQLKKERIPDEINNRYIKCL